MITEMQLTNFKAHKNTKLALGSLTVLVGVNGMGKSSTIQALLLLRQSYLSNESFNNGLIVNGDLIQIGKVGNLFNIEANEVDLLNISLKKGNKNFKWSIKYEDTSKDFVLFNRKPAKVSEIPLFNEKFQYISSHRIAPTEKHVKNDLFVELKKQISQTKGQGELAAHFLSHNRNQEIPIELRHPNFKENPFLSDQVNAWMGEISPNINIIIRNDEIGNVITLRFRFEQENLNTYTPEFIPENVGYGISQVLPVIVAVLSAQQGSLILLENPELHLHPNGQAKLVELLAKAAQYGIQIIAETHSDHIINGILVQCKRFRTEGHGINREHVKIYYFDRSEKGHYVEAKEVFILENEKITNAPKGFFDQMRKDYRELLK